MPHLIQLSLTEGGKCMERILCKPIKTRDDLDQLYTVIRAACAMETDVVVEVWQECEHETPQGEMQETLQAQEA